MMLLVKYRALGGDMLDAKLLVVEGDRATVDVVVPGTSAPLRRTRIPYLVVDNGVSRGVCFAAVCVDQAARSPVCRSSVDVAEKTQMPSRSARRAARVAAKAKPGD